MLMKLFVGFFVYLGAKYLLDSILPRVYASSFDVPGIEMSVGATSFLLAFIAAAIATSRLE